MTRNDAQDRDPDWAPDGSQLAFQSHRHGWNIYVKDLQHGPTARLIHGPAIDWAPKWAPDGTKIAYTRLGLLHQRLDLETLASWSHASKQLASLRAAPSQATV
jgi:Tol biopolymer transport system component